jgi:hypothetical protein
MEAFDEAMANKCRERDLYVHIKEMHIHMREIEQKKSLNNKKSSQKVGGRIEGI